MLTHNFAIHSLPAELIDFMKQIAFSVLQYTVEQLRLIYSSTNLPDRTSYDGLNNIKQNLQHRILRR
jgi:hypothetical protein